MTKSSKNPCGICHKNVKDNKPCLCCHNCNFRVHIKCNDISLAEYTAISNRTNDAPWFCLKCTIAENESIFPFGTLANEEFLNLYQIDIPSFVDTAPSFEIISDLMNLPNLGDYDIDEHLPANINSSYHTLQDISNSDHSQNDFSLLHMNIRSLSCHFDELFSTLVSLGIKFDVSLKLGILLNIP